MLEASLQHQTKREIIWVHGCRDREVHAFHVNIEKWSTNYKKLKKHIFYDVIDEDDNIDFYNGIVDIKKLNENIVLKDADYYLCGHSAFIIKQFHDLVERGVDRSAIHYEEFGPQILNLS